jgi:hypothetical protein
VVKIAFLYVLPLALMIYALVDCAQDDDVERTSVPKFLWIVLIIVLQPYIGPVAWLVTAKIGRPKAKAQGRRPGPTAPDDDPEFLRKLDEEARRKRRERRERDKKNDQDS